MLSPVMSAKTNHLIQIGAEAAADSAPSLNQCVPPAAPSAEPLFGLDAAALSARMKVLGEPAFRGRQLAEALYRQRVADLSEVSTLPKALRTRLLAEGWQVGRPVISQVFQSSDGTERYLIASQGGEAQAVEAVWMPEGDGGESGDGSEADVSDRFYGEEAEEQPQILRCTQDDSALLSCAPSFPRSLAERVGEHEPASVSNPENRERPEGHRQKATICVSSQVGCAVNCQFCLTARLGLQRNLTAGEIAGQVVAILDRQGVDVGRDRLNLVFMGMGEPFLNYDNFMAAVRLLVQEVGLSPRRMTVSTSGIVPGIERFALEPAEVRPKLAISLNAPNDAVRSEIMPINRKWPIALLLEAVQKIPLRPRERITFEYVLLGDVTDRPAHAAEVARLLRRSGVPAKVNLIAWNPGPGVVYQTPQAEAVERFRQTLVAAGIPAYLRKPRGCDIYAACGQLKRTVDG
jgi:23S rRNA (adenine2503-C2)-methyltransferase